MGDNNSESVHQDYELMGNLWKILKKYNQPDETEAYWDNLVEDISKLNQSQFASDLIQAVLSELERRGKCLKSTTE